MSISSLAEKIQHLQELKALKKELADQVSENNKAIEAAEKDMIADMLDMAETAGLEDPSNFTVDVGGRRYGLIIKQYCSIRKDARDQAFAALRELGLGDLIVEKVDDRTLTKALEELRDEDGNLPEEYDAIPMSVYNKTTISDRKVSK